MKVKQLFKKKQNYGFFNYIYFDNNTFRYRTHESQEETHRGTITYIRGVANDETTNQAQTTNENS